MRGTSHVGALSREDARSYMRKEQSLTSDLQVEGAVEELGRLIAGRYPGAALTCSSATRLQATVAIEDSDEVMDLVMDALYNILVERALPVYVVRNSHSSA
jgi:hypothetical protein